MKTNAYSHLRFSMWPGHRRRRGRPVHLRTGRRGSEADVQGLQGIQAGARQKIETNFGTLEFTGGAYPTPETVQKVYDELDLQRATQLYLDLFPALSVYGILKAQVRDLAIAVHLTS